MIFTAANYLLFDAKQYLKEFNLDKKFNKFMVDIETTGTKPDINHVVEISIVPFDLVPNSIIVSPPEYHLKFKLNHNQLHRTYNQQTMVWWGKQTKVIADDVFSQFYNEEINNKNVLLQLAVFITQLSKGDTQFWAKPNSFDFMFMQSLFEDLGVIFPFRYWMAVDMAGFCAGLAFKQQKVLDYTIYKPEVREKAHDSMGDCYFQLDWIQNALEDKPTKDVTLPF